MTDTVGFTYDSVGRLKTVTRNGTTTASYTYDLNGNRATKVTSAGTQTATVDDQDRLLAYGTASFHYTANGEVRRKIVGTDTTVYTYDALGNLTQVDLPDGTLVGYLIDAQNRRIGKTVNGTLTTAWLYQGQLTPVAELDGSGNVVSRFVYATGVNVPDYLVKPGAGGDSTYRLLRDHLGSVRLVVNVASGSVAQRVRYDAFGIETENTAPGWQPFGYAGGLTDPQTGLIRFGARDYDPTTGRWTAKDPIGFEGDVSNLYSYATNDAVNEVDPHGTDGLSADDVRDAADLAAGMVPGVSTGLDAIVAATGINPITGECVGALDRSLALMGLIVPGVSGGQLRGIKKLFHKHHIFPQAKEFRRLFKAAGIKIHKYTVKVEANFHLKVLHGGPNGGPWNAAWRDFFAKNVGAGHDEIMDFGRQLANRFDIGDLPWEPYR